MGREERDIRPVLLKFGLALALSFGGMLYSFLRNKNIKSSQSPDPPKSSDCSNQVNSVRDHHHASCPFGSLATDKHEDSSHNSHQHNRSNTTDKDAYLLPEFNDLVKEFDLPDTESRCHEQEIKSLRNTVKILKERERNLEIQLLEYYGLKEQETAVMELQNRLKLNNMEAKLLAVKIESLQADNRRLEAQMGDYSRVVSELEAARAKIKVLKKKLRSEAAQNKEQILGLQQRVQKMPEDVIGPEIQSKLHKLKDLEAEVEELTKSNYDLQLEKSDLSQKLDCLQILATSVLEDEETEKLKEEIQRFRKENEDLSKEIERLQGDRCADVEELVYLRWINACLRYELRNYQPGPGKTIARDLSKTLSPKSEEKAKQLILDYANKEGVVADKGVNVSEIDSDQWSSSQASNTDYGDFDESFTEDSSPRKSHSKFFGKLMKLLRGKDRRHRHHHHHRRHQDTHSRSSSIGEDMNSCSDSSVGHVGNSSESQRLRTSSVGGSSKHSVDSQKSNQRHSDVGGTVCIYKHIDSIAEGGGLVSASLSDGQKSELVKYAEVLKGTQPRSSGKFRRITSSYRSF